MSDQAKTFMVEDARIIFRNFAGKPDKFNPKGGKRTFAVVLSPEVAEEMLADGWNVKYLEARDEGDVDTPIIQIEARFDIRPPRITLLTARTRTQLKEESVEVLDFAEIKTADLIARGHDWEVGDKAGTKAYLQSLFVTIEEDALERKYADVNNDEDT